MNTEKKAKTLFGGYVNRWSSKEKFVRVTQNRIWTTVLSILVILSVKADQDKALWRQRILKTWSCKILAVLFILGFISVLFKRNLLTNFLVLFLCFAAKIVPFDSSSFAKSWHTKASRWVTSESSPFPDPSVAPPGCSRTDARQVSSHQLQVSCSRPCHCFPLTIEDYRKVSVYSFLIHFQRKNSERSEYDEWIFSDWLELTDISLKFFGRLCKVFFLLLLLYISCQPVFLFVC